MTCISAPDIEIAWFHASQACLTYGRVYQIQRGSYAGQRRWQLDSLTLRIATARIPETLTLRGQVIATRAQIEAYFMDYLLSKERPPNCDYTYGERLRVNLRPAIARLRETPQSNQIFLPVARPHDTFLDDPPCLQSITLQVAEGRVNLHSYWRSWDVCNALPVNLGGLALLGEWLAAHADLEMGALYAYSSGAHLYEHSVKLWRG